MEGLVNCVFFVSLEEEIKRYQDGKSFTHEEETWVLV